MKALLLNPVTPATVDEPIRQFVRDIGCGPAEHIPVLSGGAARLAASIANVSEAIRHSGGGIRYGRMIWECSGLWVGATFHAVRATRSGLLIDHTPKETISDSRTLFAVDPSFNANSDVTEQPKTIRRRIYGAPGWPGACVSEGKGGGGRKRARPDVVASIDGYLKLLEENDTVFLAGRDGRVCVDGERATELDRMIAMARRRLLRLLKEAQ